MASTTHNASEMCTSQTNYDIFAKIVFTIHQDWIVLLDLIIFTRFNAAMYLQFFIVTVCKMYTLIQRWFCLVCLLLFTWLRKTSSCLPGDTAAIPTGPGPDSEMEKNCKGMDGKDDREV